MQKIIHEAEEKLFSFKKQEDSLEETKSESTQSKETQDSDTGAKILRIREELDSLKKEIKALDTKRNKDRCQLKKYEELLNRSMCYRFDEKFQEKFLASQKSKAVFVSGIYTVDPFTEESIFRLAKDLRIGGHNNLEILSRRELNILHFGMIRGEKGVDEAIELGKYLENMGSESKVIVAGKLMLDLAMVNNLFRRVFDLKPLEFYVSLVKALSLQNVVQSSKDLTVKTVRNFSQVEKWITSEKKHEVFNQFCMNLYRQLKEERPTKGKNIEIHFNVSEDELRKIAMRCRYAIKLDHKGMANNASTMATCLGLYLPVITTPGLVTNKEFMSFELSNRKQNVLYADTVIMSEIAYSADNQYNEVRPVLPSVEQIHNFLVKESPERYLERLVALQRLHLDKVFDCDQMVGQLIHDIFLPLVEELNLVSSASCHY